MLAKLSSLKLKSRWLAHLFNFILLAGAGSSSWALDLGVQGKTWEIGEKDIRQDIMESAARVNWDDVNKKLKSEAPKFAGTRPQYDLPRATQNKNFLVDVSYVVKEDIKIPKKNSKGDYEWVVLYPKGTKVNPLKEGYKPVSYLLFFDGSDKDQLRFAKTLSDTRSDEFIFIETSGNPDESSKQFKNPVFYADPMSINKFNLKKTPSLVYPGEDKQLGFIVVTELAYPYSIEYVAKMLPDRFGSYKRKKSGIELDPFLNKQFPSSVPKLDSTDIKKGGSSK